MPKKHKILMVEDEPDLAQIFIVGLTKGGFTVELARNGVEAVGKVKEVNPDLVLLDLIMPEMNGYGVLEKIAQDKKTKKFKIFVWSNLTQQDEIAKAKKLGADEYLIKSGYTPTALAEKIKTLLG